MWSVVGTFSTVGEAEGARSALDAGGIESSIDDENTIAVDWLYSNALGGLKVLVSPEQREEAIQILSTAAESASDIEAAEEGVDVPEQPMAALGADASRCPACQSGEVERVPRLKLFAAVAIIVYGVGVAVDQVALSLAAMTAVALIAAMMPSHRCLTCGERWSSGQDAGTDPDAPLPDPADTVEACCPRCGSPELEHATYRRLRSLPLLAFPSVMLIVPLWLVLPKWKCDRCGLWLWLRPRVRE